MKGYQNVKGSKVVLASRGTFNLRGDKYKEVLLMTRYVNATEQEILGALSNAADNVMQGSDNEFDALEKCIVDFQPEIWEELANDPAELLERLDVHIDAEEGEMVMMRLGVVPSRVLRYVRQHHKNAFLYRELFMGLHPPGHELSNVRIYLQENGLPSYDLIDTLLESGVRKSDVLEITGDYERAEDLVDNFYASANLNDVGDSSDYFLLEDCAETLECIDAGLDIVDGDDVEDSVEVAIN